MGFRLTIDNMGNGIRSQSPGHPQDTQVEVLVAVFTVRPDRKGRVCLQVLLWQRAREPAAGRWALPGGLVLTAEDVDASASRQLAQKVDLARVAHLEQIGVFSDPERVPGSRVVATGFLGLVPLDADPRLPEDTAWHPVDDLPPTALEHDVDPTNLQRILTRRGMLEPTGTTAASGPTGGRPAAMYRFTIHELRVTDPFAAFRPPPEG